MESETLSVSLAERTRAKKIAEKNFLKNFEFGGFAGFQSLRFLKIAKFSHFQMAIKSKPEIFKVQFSPRV